MSEYLFSHSISLPIAALLPIALMTALARAGDPALVDEFLAAADQGSCIEDQVYRKVRQAGSQGDTAHIVRSALAALAQRTPQQQQLGCGGDIAAQAIAAGADPDDVLGATAAGL